MATQLEEYIEKHAQEILDSKAKAAAKDQLIDHSTKSVTREDAEIAKDFFMALATKSETRREAVNARIAKQYEARQKAGQTIGTIGTGICLFIEPPDKGGTNASSVTGRAYQLLRQSQPVDVSRMDRGYRRESSHHTRR